MRPEFSVRIRVQGIELSNVYFGKDKLNIISRMRGDAIIEVLWSEILKTNLNIECSVQTRSSIFPPVSDFIDFPFFKSLKYRGSRDGNILTTYDYAAYKLTYSIVNTCSMHTAVSEMNKFVQEVILTNCVALIKLCRKILRTLSLPFPTEDFVIVWCVG